MMLIKSGGYYQLILAINIIVDTRTIVLYVNSSLHIFTKKYIKTGKPQRMGE